MAVAIVKYYDFTGSAAVAGSNFRIAAITYLDNLGVSNNFLGPIDLSDAAATAAYFEAFVDGLIRYSVTSGNQSFVLRTTVYRLTEVNLLYNDTNGNPQFVLIPLTEDRSRYEHDVDVVRGCRDADAENYNSLATETDGSCIYESISPEDQLRDMVNAYNLEKTKHGLIGSEKSCCCDAVKGRFLNRVVEISQRIVNNTTEISPEVRATAVIDFTSFDFGTLTDNMTIEVSITFEDGTVLVLTSITGDFFGMSSTDFLTLVTLNINLDSPDFNAVYPGSGLVIDILAAPDYGESINAALIQINFVDTLGVGDYVPTGETFNPGENAAHLGPYLYFTDQDTIGRVLRVDPTGVQPTLSYVHSKMTATGSNWACAFPHDGYKSYKRLWNFDTSADANCKSLSIYKDSPSVPLLDGVVFVGYNDDSIAAIYPDGTSDICPTSIGVITGIVVRGSNFNPAVIFCLNSSVNPGVVTKVEYSGIGLWTVTVIGPEATFAATSACPGLIYNSFNNKFYVAIGLIIAKLDPTGFGVDDDVTLGGPALGREILTVNPVNGIVYATPGTASGNIGHADVIAIDPTTHVATTAVTLAFALTGKIGVKSAALLADVRYYMCEYNTNVVHVLDGNFVQVDTITVKTKDALSTYVVGCIYDDTTGLLTVLESTIVNLLGSPHVMLAVIDPTTAGGVLQNVLAPNGYASIISRGGLNVDVYNGNIIHKDVPGFIRSAFYKDGSSIVGQVIFGDSEDGGSNNTLAYFDVLSDFTLEESAFEFFSDTLVFSYAMYNYVTQKIISYSQNGSILFYFDRSQKGYLPALTGWNASSFGLSTGTGLLGVYNPRNLSINGVTGRFTVSGVPYAGGVTSEFIIYNGVTYTEVNTTTELDSILSIEWDSNNNQIWVFGLNGTDYTIAIYSSVGVLVTTIIVSGFDPGGGYELSFDLENEIMFLNHLYLQKIYVFDLGGNAVAIFDLLIEFSDLSSFYGVGLLYWVDGISYGAIKIIGTDEVSIYPVSLIPATPYIALGTFDEGLDAILQTEEDECLTFEENDSLVEKARQLVISCIRNEK